MKQKRLRQFCRAVTLALPLVGYAVLAHTNEGFCIEVDDGMNRSPAEGSGITRVAQAESLSAGDEPSDALSEPRPDDTMVGAGSGDLEQPVTERPAMGPDRVLVRDIQVQLSRRGFNPGPADGIMGPATARAISSFQQSMGLSVDGRASAELLDLLRLPRESQPAEATAAAPEPVTPAPAVPEAIPPGESSVATGIESRTAPEPEMSLAGTTWRFTDETGSTIVLEFAANGAVKGTLYEQFWKWKQDSDEVVISYDNGMGLSVTRTGTISTDTEMSGHARASRGEEWSWNAERLPTSQPDTVPAEEQAQPDPAPEPGAEFSAPAESLEQAGRTGQIPEDLIDGAGQGTADSADTGGVEDSAALGTPPNDGLADDSEQAEATATAPAHVEAESPIAQMSPSATAQPIMSAKTNPEESSESTSNDQPEQIEREPQVYGQDGSDARIVIRAVAESWLEVTDADGRILFSRVLRTGDSYRAPASSGATFVTGNAGGIEILVDGQPVPSLGPAGKVMSDVALDPDLLKSGAAWQQGRTAASPQ